MTEIAGGRWDRLLRKLFPVKGPSIAPSIAPELLPVVQVQNWEPELYILRSETRWSSFCDQIAIGGQSGYILLSNPADSGVLAIIEDFWHSVPDNNVSASMGILSSMPIPANFGTVGQLDTRQISNYAAACTVMHDTNVIGAGETCRMNRSPAKSNKAWQPVVVHPNYGYLLWSRTVNVNFFGTLFWRERPIEPSEYP